MVSKWDTILHFLRGCRKIVHCKWFTSSFKSMQFLATKRTKLSYPESIQSGIIVPYTKGMLKKIISDRVVWCDYLQYCCYVHLFPHQPLTKVLPPEDIPVLESLTVLTLEIPSVNQQHIKKNKKSFLNINTLLILGLDYVEFSTYSSLWISCYYRNDNIFEGM